MKHRKFLSTLLALAILLSCVGWTPSRAEEAMPELQMEQSQAAARRAALELGLGGCMEYYLRFGV